MDTEKILMNHSEKIAKLEITVGDIKTDTTEIKKLLTNGIKSMVDDHEEFIKGLKEAPQINPRTKYMKYGLYLTAGAFALSNIAVFAKMFGIIGKILEAFSGG